MARAIVILLLAWLVAGCASGGIYLDDRQALISEISDDVPRLSPSTVPAREETAPGTAQAEDPPTGQSEGNRKSSVDPRKRGQQPEQQEEPGWERADEETEKAIIKDHLRRTEKYREHQRSRVWGVNGYVQIDNASKRSALESFSIGDPKWDDLLNSGWGVGLDMSWEPVPAFQPFLGVQYTRNTGKSSLILGSSQAFNLETSPLQMMPFYGGIRFNFPLNESFSDWFSTSAAGLSTGVIPYIRVAGGGTYVFGNEIEITDLATPPPTKLDFIGRGFTGYVEGAVGIEYRTKDGFAFRVSVAIQSYPGIRLDRSFENAYPGTDLERLDMIVLPRISATYYF